ncbi:MAG: hypothetical protein KDC71_14720 [Acidobacteria bacterium]|nr:hypothetical protein [Acidobacteriota bacterium]
MNSISAIGKGLAQGSRFTGTITLYWVVALLFSSIWALPLLQILASSSGNPEWMQWDQGIALDQAISAVFAYAASLKASAWMTIPILLSFLVFQMLVRAAAAHQYHQRKRLGWSPFWATGFRYLPGMILISLGQVLHIVLWVFVYDNGISAAGDWVRLHFTSAWVVALWAWIHWALVGLIVLAVLAAHRCAIAFLVSDPVGFPKGLFAFMRGIFFVLAHPIRSLSVSLFFFVLGGILLFANHLLAALAGPIANPVLLFLVGQVFLFLKTWNSFCGLASFTQLVSSGPQPKNKPDSYATQPVKKPDIDLGLSPEEKVATPDDDDIYRSASPKE